MNPTRRLSESQRAALVAGARKDRAEAPRAPVHKPAAAAPGFDSIPAYEPIRLQKQVADQLGIAVPFYREHGARAGAATVLDGRDCANFTSYDYLGLNGHPAIVDAVSEAAARWGTSVSASRLTSGERPFHRQLEGELARLYRAEAALLFVSGHATNIATIATIVGPGDLVVHDALAHNSIVLGAEMSGAHRVTFPHNDIAALDRQLTALRGQFRNCLVVTEGLFSMDGDGPDLAALVTTKQRHRAWLMIDEAHSLGVLGSTGRGLAEHTGVDPAEVDIWMGTLSKTLVSCGGYIAGSAVLIEILRYAAPGMVYSVGIPPTATAAASAALDLMLREPGRVAALRANGARFHAAAAAAGLDCGRSWGLAIAPILIGDSLQTVLLADRLLAQRVVAVPVIPPAVPERQARLRFFLSAAHSAEQIDHAVATLAAERSALARSGVSLARFAETSLAARLGHGETG